MVKLLVIQKGGRTTKQSMTNFLYNNIFWFIFYTLLLSIQMLPETSSDQEDEEGVAQNPSGQEEEGLPQEIFHALCGAICFALVLNIVLVYFQLWRPFKVKQKRSEDIESCEEIDHEGSCTAWFCLPAVCAGQCGIILVAALVVYFWAEIIGLGYIAS